MTVEQWVNKFHPKLYKEIPIIKILIRAIEEEDNETLEYFLLHFEDELLNRVNSIAKWNSLLSMVLGEKDYDGKLVLKKGVPSVVSPKDENNGNFKELIKKLSALNIECTKRFGYFFGKKDLKEQAANEFSHKKYELEKSYLMITAYYENWNSDINPKNLYNFILSDDFKAHYFNFKQKETFWE